MPIFNVPLAFKQARQFIINVKSDTLNGDAPLWCPRTPHYQSSLACANHLEVCWAKAAYGTPELPPPFGWDKV